MSDYKVGDTIYHHFSTRAFGTGIPTTLIGSPVAEAYEEANATGLTAGVSLTIDHVETGHHLLTIVATGGNSFETGKSYGVSLTAGTVDGVSVVGEVIFNFTLEKSPAAQNLANGSDGLTALKTGIDAIPTTMRGTDDALLAANAPSNFADMSITLTTGLVDITQAAADKVWGTAARILTASTNFNDITADSVWAVDATNEQTQGTFGQAIGDPVADADTIYGSVVTGAAGANIAADIIAVKAETALIVEDTGTTIPGTITTLQADIDDIQTRLPAALVGGAMDCDVSAMQAGAIASGVISAAELTNIENEIWDALKSAHVIANSFGDFLDIEVSSRLAPTTAARTLDVLATGEVPIDFDTSIGSLAAAQIEASALNGKGDWNIGKTGYTLTQAFPANFADLVIAATTGELDVNVVEWLASAAPALVGGRLDASVGAMAAAVLTAAAINAAALDGKGDWNIGKTGYSLSQAFPTNFADMSITVTTGLVDITQTAADKVWSTAARILTASTNFNDLSAAEVLAEVNIALDTAISELGVAAPTATPSLRTGLMLLYMALRNQFKTQTVATDAVEIYNDADTLITKKLITDDGSDYVEAKMT